MGMEHGTREEADRQLMAMLTAERPPERLPVDPEKRKAEIRAEATRLFAARGFDGVNYTEVAASLDLPLRACTQYYRTRDSLVYAILHEHVTALHEVLEAADPVEDTAAPAAPTGTPPLARLEAMATALLDALAEREAAQRVLLAAMHTLPTLGDETLRYILRGVVWRFERVLLLAVPRLRRRRGLLFPVAASLVAMAAHYVLWFRDDGRLARTEYARLIARMAVRGASASFRAQIGRRRGRPKRLPMGARLGMERAKRASCSPR